MADFVSLLGVFSELELYDMMIDFDDGVLSPLKDYEVIHASCNPWKRAYTAGAEWSEYIDVTEYHMGMEIVPGYLFAIDHELKLIVYTEKPA